MLYYYQNSIDKWVYLKKKMYFELVQGQDSRGSGSDISEGIFYLSDVSLNFGDRKFNVWA